MFYHGEEKHCRAFIVNCLSGHLQALTKTDETCKVEHFDITTCSELLRNGYLWWFQPQPQCLLQQSLLKPPQAWDY